MNLYKAKVKVKSIIGHYTYDERYYLAGEDMADASKKIGDYLQQQHPTSKTLVSVTVFGSTEVDQEGYFKNIFLV